MRRRACTLAAALGVLPVGVAGSPQHVAADHCFGVFVEPSSGPVGTVFVIRQNGADPGIVTLFHDGSRVARHRLDVVPDALRFHSSPGDVGHWRAHLEIPQGDPPCGPNDSFSVTAVPDTATDLAPAASARLDGEGAGGPAWPLLLAPAGVAAALIVARRMAAER